jgi:hypothetical protein
MAKKGPGIPPSRRDRGQGSEGGGSSEPTGPIGYEQKFAEFVRMCSNREGGPEVVFVHHPAVLGDNYAELIESLSRLAEANLALRISERQPATTAVGEPAARPVAEKAGPRKGLPRPNVSVPESGDDPAKFGEAGIRGMFANPIYAGIADYPRMVPDEQWIAAARDAIQQDGADQFLVNLLYVLRRTFGCVEWGGDMPPDSN